MTVGGPERVDPDGDVYKVIYKPPPIPIPLTPEAAAAIDWQGAVPADEETLKWFVWAGFYSRAEQDSLEVVEVIDKGEVPRTAISPTAEQALGHDPAEFVWHRWWAVARRPDIVEWCQAEAVYDAGQDALEQAKRLEAPQVWEEPDAQGS